MTHPYGTKASPDLLQKITELSRVKHLMNNWESHPKGESGPRDNGGFMEGIEAAVKHGWNMTPNRIATIEKLYAKCILGETRGRSQTPLPAGDGDSFRVGDIEGMRATEGWRLKINGTLVGVPVIREHAYIIALWLDKSYSSLERYLTMSKPKPPAPDDAERINNETVDEF